MVLVINKQNITICLTVHKHQCAERSVVVRVSLLQCSTLASMATDCDLTKATICKFFRSSEVNSQQRKQDAVTVHKLVLKQHTR